MSREPGLRWDVLQARSSRGGPARWHPASRARPGSEIRAGDYRAGRQMALRTRRRSTCRRTTRSGSVTLIASRSHVTDRTVQAASGMWTVRRVTSGAIRVLTRLSRPPFPVIPLLSRPPPGPSAAARWRRGQPWRSQLSGGSDAASAGSVAAGWCWQSHQLPPGHSSWRRFRHGTQIMPPLCGPVRPSACLQEPGRAAGADVGVGRYGRDSRDKCEASDTLVLPSGAARCRRADPTGPGDTASISLGEHPETTWLCGLSRSRSAPHSYAPGLYRFLPFWSLMPPRAATPGTCIRILVQFRVP
jgi:hypothetical protein